MLRIMLNLSLPLYPVQSQSFPLLMIMIKPSFQLTIFAFACQYISTRSLTNLAKQTISQSLTDPTQKKKNSIHCARVLSGQQANHLSFLLSFHVIHKKTEVAYVLYELILTQKLTHVHVPYTLFMPYKKKQQSHMSYMGLLTHKFTRMYHVNSIMVKKLQCGISTASYQSLHMLNLFS